MSQQEITRWTCDRCGHTVDQPDRPEVWQTVGGRDVCFTCMQIVNRFVNSGPPDVAKLEKYLQTIQTVTPAVVRRVLKLTTDSEEVGRG